MRYRFACDCHNHSSCSPDGNDTVLEMRRRAQELGLWAHTLTDHCECQKFPDRYRPRVERAWEKMALEIPQGGSTRFYRGIELGQPNQALIEYLQEWKRNDNLPEIIEFYGHNSRKISCDYYIDDRMLLPENAKA